MSNNNTYRGTGKLVTDKNKALSAIGMMQARNLFNKQLVCVAEKEWLDTCYETTNNNDGDCVIRYISEYSRGVNKRAEPYCVSGVGASVWQANKLLGADAKFPEYARTYANAKKTADLLKTNHPVKRIPEAGQIFYRFSSSQSSSGHMGIVISVTGNDVYTVEWNVLSKDNKEGVGLWVYSRLEMILGQYGFMLFDIGESAKTANNTLQAYKGYSCNPVSIAKKTATKSSENCVRRGAVTRRNPNPSYEVQKRFVINGKSYYDTFIVTGGKYGDRHNLGGHDGDNIKYPYTVHISNVGKFAFDPDTCEIIENTANNRIYNAIDKSTDPDKPPKPYTAEKKAECKKILLTIPTGGAVSDWRILQNDPLFMADVMNAHKPRWGTIEDRNGAGIGYRNVKLQKPVDKKGNRHDGYSGIGVVSQGKNVYYFVNEEHAAAYRLVTGDYKEFGNQVPRLPIFRDAITLDIARNSWNQGNGWKEKFIDNFIQNEAFFSFANNSLNLLNDNRTEERQLKNILKDNWRDLRYHFALGQNWGVMPRMFEILERKNWNSNNRPVVFIIKNTPPALSSAYDLLTFTSAVLTVAIPIASPAIAPTLGLIKKVANNVNNVAKTIDLGNGNLGSMVQDVYDIVYTLAPDQVRSAEGVVDQYINKAKNYYNSLANDFSKYTLKGIANDAGIPIEELEKTINRYTKNIGTSFGNVADVLPDLTKTAKDFVGNAKSQMNFQNMLMVDRISKKSKSGTILDDIIEAGGAGTLPIMEDMFISSVRSGIIKQIPNSQKLLSALSNSQWLNTVAQDTKNNVMANLTASVLGYIPDGKMFNEPVKNILMAQAEKYAREKIPFVLPASLDPETTDCLEYEIQQAVGGEVIGCREGWTYDVSRGRCVKTVNTFNGYGGNNGVGNTTTSGGGTSSTSGGGTTTNTGGGTTTTGDGKFSVGNGVGLTDKTFDWNKIVSGGGSSTTTGDGKFSVGNGVGLTDKTFDWNKIVSGGGTSIVDDCKTEQRRIEELYSIINTQNKELVTLRNRKHECPDCEQIDITQYENAIKFLKERDRASLNENIQLKQQLRVVNSDIQNKNSLIDQLRNRECPELDTSIYDDKIKRLSNENVKLKSDSREQSVLINQLKNKKCPTCDTSLLQKTIQRLKTEASVAESKIINLENEITANSVAKGDLEALKDQSLRCKELADHLQKQLIRERTGFQTERQRLEELQRLVPSLRDRVKELEAHKSKNSQIGNIPIGMTKEECNMCDIYKMPRSVTMEMQYHSPLPNNNYNNDCECQTENCDECH
jgi:hypothetical protein